MGEFTSLQVWVEKTEQGWWVHEWVLRADGVVFYRVTTGGEKPGPWRQTEGA